MLAQLASEAVARVHGRGATDDLPQSGVVSDEANSAGPRREDVQALGERHADQRTDGVARASGPARRGEVLALAGATFVFLAAIGVVRFPDALSRMHPLSKASTLGVLLILAGAAVNLRDVNDLTSVVPAAILHLLTSPSGSNMVSRATYLAGGMPTGHFVIDEGAATLRRGVEKRVQQ